MGALGSWNNCFFKSPCGHTTVHLQYKRLSLHVPCEPRKAAQRVSGTSPRSHSQGEKKLVQSPQAQVFWPVLQAPWMGQPWLILRSKPPDGNDNLRQFRAELPEAFPRTFLFPSLWASGERPGLALSTCQSHSNTVGHPRPEGTVR